MAIDHFRQFVNHMDQLIRENESVDGRGQKVLLDELFRTENGFKTLLLSSPSGQEIYARFMDYILKTGIEAPTEKLKPNFIPESKEAVIIFQQKVFAENRNILRARPYFRERQNTFSAKISKAFHSKRPYLLHKFRINYEFAKWVIERYKGPNQKELHHLFHEIIRLRNLLCTNNLPLAINRAHIFYSKVPNTHLEYMDLIQASSEGLLTAIDKFVPPYKAVFRSTAIGRMTLNMTDDQTALLVKLSPKQKRILYRAKNAKNKAHLYDDAKILNYVQESFKDVSASDLSEIEVAASQAVRMDTPNNNSLPPSAVMADTAEPVDSVMSRRETESIMMKALSELYMGERKVVLLKFGALYGSD